MTVHVEDEDYELPIEGLTGRIELAYAIGVHKAQGSQFKRVAIAVSKSRLLDHALIYTALTRGIEQVVLVCDRDALASAVLNAPSALRREVALEV